MSVEVFPMANLCEQIETPHQKTDMRDASTKLSCEATGLSTNKTPGRTMVSFGQVESVILNADWEHGISQQTPTPFTEYHSSKFPETKLCFYYRGHRMSDESSANFARTLAKPDHPLSKAELKSLEEVLGVKSDEQAFKMLDARTKSLNGKRVMILRGTYTEKQYETEAVYVDSDGTGGTVQEIYWQSPRMDYLAQSQAKASLRSVLWK